MSNSNKILFKMSGSIACYKACQVISRLVQAGHEVQVVATASALKFVGEATLEGLTGKKVVSEIFERGSHMDHINLAKWADLVILAPASANTLNKLGNGIGDDLVSTLFLAHDFSKPYLLAPAMNTKMYQHPATQASLKKLQSWGVSVLETASGVLACGDTGEGKLLDPDLILEEINLALKAKQALRPMRVLITSGGTTEPIDTVRSITNFSSGRTGSTIAEYFAKRGHSVSFLFAEGTHTPQNRNVSLHEFSTFTDIDTQLTQLISSGNFDAVIHAAAISDFSVASVSINGKQFGPSEFNKIESGSALSIDLKPNHKILPTLKSRAKNPLLVAGFKLTSGASAAERLAAVKKVATDIDLVVHNDLSEITPDQHKSTLYIAGKEAKKCSTKAELAIALENFIVQLSQARNQEVRA